MATNSPSTVQLVKEDENTYSFNTSSTFRPETIKFILNEVFIDEMLSCAKAKCIVSFEGNKMIQQQQDGKKIRIEREFSEKELVAKFIVEDKLIATRWFKAVD